MKLFTMTCSLVDSRRESEPGHRRGQRSPVVVLRLMVMAWSALVFLPGCSPLNFNLAELDFNNDDKPVTPSRMIPVWTDTVLTRSGKKGVRGFGGRIVFYQTERHESVHVDGSLTVYAWDDSAGHELSDVPDRKYVITAEKLESHFSESRVGPSYSIWIPWDEAGGEHRKITLLTRFVGTNGAEVVSQPIQAVLPGAMQDRMVVKKSTLTPVVQRTPNTSAEPGAFPSGGSGEIQQASWQSADEPRESSEGLPRMKTTTLDVSPSFAARHFGDNSMPLNLDQRRLENFASANDQDPQSAASLTNGHSADSARSANRSPSAHSSRTPLPARTGSPESPVHSPLRSQPRRATWQPRYGARPQSPPETSSLRPETPPVEPGDRPPAAERRAPQTQW